MGARNKTPRIDGICLEFYIANWDTIRPDLLELLNQTFLHKKIRTQQKYGTTVCLPKHNGDRTPEGYCPISLLTTEYKIMAQCLRIVLEDHLSSNQFCGVPGNSTLDAVSQMRDAMAHPETTGTPLCILSLDFQNAFDRISHQYLFQILQRYRITTGFIERIKELYNNAMASLHIN
jgi:hypothetical protein